MDRASVTQPAFRVKDDLKAVEAFLIDKGLEEVTEEGFKRFQTRLEKNLSVRYEEEIQQLKLKHQKEIERLEAKAKEDANIVCEFKALYNSLALFKQKTWSGFEKGDSLISKDELETLSHKLAEFDKDCYGFSTLVSGVSQTLTESIRRELSLRSELIVLKTRPPVSDPPVSASQDCRFVKLEHSLDVCNHNKEKVKFVDILKKSNDKGLCEIFSGSEGEKQSALLDFSTDMDNLLNYIEMLNKYIREMVDFYTSRCYNVLNVEKSSLVDLSHDRLGKTLESATTDEAATDVKECHKLLLSLNELLKTYDSHLEEALRTNKQLKEEMGNLKQNHSERVFSLDSQIKLMNEKIIVCLRENKAVESKLQELRSFTVSKQQYDLLEKEKDLLVETNEKLKQQLQAMLNADNSIIEPVVPNNQKGDSVNATGDADEHLFNFKDISTDNESPIRSNAATSTPFHPKVPANDRKDTDVLENSLIEWIDRCHLLESDKKRLEQYLFNVEFLSKMANCRKDVLQQEVNVLRTDVKSLEEKLKNYISLKEKCQILENDNIILNIKNKYFDKLFGEEEQVGNKEIRDIRFDENVCSSALHTSESAFNCIHKFYEKNQKLLISESKCRFKDSQISRLGLKLQLSKELEMSLKNKTEDLMKDNVKMYEKLSDLIKDCAQAKLEKKVCEIQMESLKDQLTYLTSFMRSLKDDSNHNLIQSMQDEAKNFLKNCVEKLSEVKAKTPNSGAVDKLDSRHCLDILVTDNNLLRSDKEEILLRLTSLQHQFHLLQKKSDVVDSEWYVNLDRFERELKSELEEQRKQHRRTEEALRSTAQLQSLLSSAQQEVCSLTIKLDEEKQNTKTCQSEVVLLQNQLHDKQKLMQEIIDENAAIRSRLVETEKELAQNKTNYEAELLKAKWTNNLHCNKSILTQVKEELTMLCEEVSGQETEQRLQENEWDLQSKALDVVYQESLNCLRYLLEEERSRALAQAASDRKDQVRELAERVEELVAKVNNLECGRSTPSQIPITEGEDIGIVVPAEIKANRELLYKELESSAKSMSDEQMKLKLENYFDRQFNLSLSWIKEELRRRSEVRLRAAEELHQEELILLRLTSESETNSKLRCLAEDQLKREKNLINKLIEIGPNHELFLLDRFKRSITALLLHFLSRFLSSWEKNYLKEIKDLEKQYEDFMNTTAVDPTAEDDNSASIHHLDRIENLVNAQNSVIDNTSRFMKELEACLSSLLKSAKDFVKESGSELRSTVEKLRKKDLDENSTELQHQIKVLQADRDRLQLEQSAAVGLLVKEHDEELLRISSIVDNLKPSSGIEKERLADEIRSELEAKHVKEVEELRTYYEQKCSDLEKIFSEEVVSQHSCRMSVDSTCSSEGEMLSEENTFDPAFVATLIVTDSSVCGNPVGSDLISELYTGDDMVRGLPINRYFVHLEAMDQVLLKHKVIVDKVEARWRDRTRSLLTDLEKSCSQRLQSDRDVDRLVADIKNDYSKELNWINVVKGAEALEQSFKSEAERQYEAEITRLEQEFEARLQIEVENLARSHKKREKEAIWEAKVEAEETRKQELHSLDNRWERRYVDDMASHLARAAIAKVEFEAQVKEMVEGFERAARKNQEAVQQRLADEACRLEELSGRLSGLTVRHTDLLKAEQLYAVEKDVIQKNCNNLLRQNEMDAKKASDLLISMYEKELAQLEENHRQEMKLTLDKHTQAMNLLTGDHQRSGPEEGQNFSVQSLANIMDLIMDYVEKAYESSPDNGLTAVPAQLLPLEKSLKSRVSRLLDHQALKHSHDLDELRQRFLSKLDNYSKGSDDEKDSDSSRSVLCQTGDTKSHHDMEQLIRERDSLRKLSESLKSVVDQLTCYLQTCEEEVNKTVVEQLMRAALALSPQDSPVRTVSKEKRVHFAPDVSKILDSSYSCDAGIWDISLGDPEVSLKLKNELDSCLSKLKRETAEIFKLSVTNRHKEYLSTSESTLADMARQLLADKSSPSADIAHVIEELTQEGDRLIQQLQQEKEDLQHQMWAADNQLKSTRQFLEDQAVEREAERDEFSRELSLLQSRQLPNSGLKNQALTSQLSRFHRRAAVTSSRQTQSVEELEKQLLVCSSDLETAEANKKALEAELKDSMEKMKVLTEIIGKLENQLMVKSDREECLEKKLDQLEAELEHQSLAQIAMANEMESLKSRDSEDNYMDQISALQEELKLQYSSTIIRNIKSQLREIERNIANRTKELEAFNLDCSSTSLSSPSEEISIREHLEMMRSQTPEQCPSPVALPVEEVNRLQDRVHRHSRAEDMLLKKIKEQELRLSKLSSTLTEVEAEREVLQQSVDKLSSQLGKANSRADELRRKADAAHSQATEAAAGKLAELEHQAASLRRSLDQAQSQLQEKELQVERAKELIEEQKVKLSSARESSPQLVQALRLQLASTVAENNRLHELVEKYRGEVEALDLSPLYNCLLTDKNEDIQQLQRTVSILQNQQQQVQHVDDEEVSQEYSGRRSRRRRSVAGKATSYLEELSPIVRMDSRIREVPQPSSLPSFSLRLQDHKTDKMVDELEGESRYEGPVEPTLSPNIAFELHRSVCAGSQSVPGEEKINKLESEVKSLRSMVVDLTDAKQDVESYISSFTDDRKYYECQLNKLLEEKRAQEAEIEKLRHTLVKKDNEIENTTADVTKLQVILSNLQEKLKRASDLAFKDNDLKKELSDMKEKCSTLEDVLDRFYKFREDLGSINDDFKFQENNDDYFQNVLSTLRQKLRKTTDIELSNGNLKRQNDDLKNELYKLKHDNDAKRRELTVQISSLKSEMNKVLQDNDKLKQQVENYLILKENNSELEAAMEQLRLRYNLMEVELNSLKTENNKLVEELESLRTELKFKTLHNSLEPQSKEGDAASLEQPVQPENVTDLEDLTYEIEKQLDLSVKLDNSLLNTIGDKSYQKKEGGRQEEIRTTLPPQSKEMKEERRTRSGGIAVEGDGLVGWLAREVDAWQAVGSKQHELTSQLSNLSRLAQTQDNRITRLLVELDSKKKECIVMELELLREKRDSEHAQRLLEMERHRSATLHKEDTHLIEMLRVRLEGSLKAESQLKTELLEERRRHEELEARLNSARALETYIQSSESGDSARNVREGLMLRLEVDRLKQVNGDLEQVIARERNYQASLKDKLKLIHLQSTASEKQAEELKVKLSQEIKLRESIEEQLRNALEPPVADSTTPDSPKHDTSTRTAMNNLLAEIRDWKEECLQLREGIRLQREHEDYWTANVQTPLIKQLQDVNRSLGSLVREKVSLQTYVTCIEKERDFLRTRLEKLEEMNEKLSSSRCVPIATQTPYNFNLQSLINKLQYLAEANHKMEKQRKALVWQKRFLQVCCDGYKRTAALTLETLDPLALNLSQNKKKPSFRCVVYAISACIKLSYIQRRRKASRRAFMTRMRTEIGLIQSPAQPLVFSDLGRVDDNLEGLANNNNINSTTLTPPTQYLYTVTKLSESGGGMTEASKLSQYITMFDQMQKRLGKIIQNDNL